MKKNIILYVGANDGTVCLPLAENNKGLFIHAFEPNPALVKKIKNLKKKIERLKGIEIKNFKIHQLAIGNKNKNIMFNISIHDKVSSIKKLSKNIEDTWPGLKDSVFKVKKRINVKMITLSNFLKNSLNANILYLHVDTQGNDINVLKGLGNNLLRVKSGKIEVAINKKRAAYQNSGTLNEAKRILLKNKFEIKVSKIDRVFDNEVDIVFNKKNFSHKFLNSINSRFYLRILENRLTNKDSLIIFFIKFFNKIKKKVFI